MRCLRELGAIFKVRLACDKSRWATLDPRRASDSRGDHSVSKYVHYRVSYISNLTATRNVKCPSKLVSMTF